MTTALEHLIDLSELDTGAISVNARRLATLSLLDWISVMLAAAHQPLSAMMRKFADAEGGYPMASVAGSRVKAPTRAAALVNGTISHALDYDDTHFAHIGHLSVGIYPAALAAGEECDTSATAVRDAFLLGAEAACRFGMLLGREHYQRGFHQTATAGAFGATIAAGRIYGLDRQQMRNALNLVSTRASGLKSQFGSMGKPYNAGIAASNGIEAASLARHGFQSCDDGIEGVQGFVETHSNAPQLDLPWRDLPPKCFIFESNKYKLHACCHGTHAMIEALRELKERHNLDPFSIKAVFVRTHPRWLKVCDIKLPRTGLEVKFSYAWLAAMVICGINTASEKVYSDSLCEDQTLAQIAKSVSVIDDESLSETETELAIETKGERITQRFDLAAAIPLEVLEKGLLSKAEGLVGKATAVELWKALADIEALPASAFGSFLRRV